MEIKLREYYCPLCNSFELHSTNHIGNIYCNCKVCGASILYCTENKNNLKEVKKAHFVFYKYDMEDKIQKALYKTLCKELNKIGYKKFDTFSNKYREAEELENISSIIHISIYNSLDKNQQHITNKGRLHNWFEFIFPNKDVKKGYYLRFP